MHNERTRLQIETLEERTTPSVYYVATTGSNSAPGTSEQPWQTLQYAADRVQRGDTVIVRAGTYVGFNLFTDGTAAEPITFRADSGVTIDRPNPWNGRDGINLEGSDYVTVEGFRVIDQPRAGLRAALNSFVTFRNNIAENNGGWGIFTGFSEDLTIENNVASGSITEHGIYVSNSADRPVIRGNRVFNNNGSGIQLNADVSMGGDGIISEARIENNIITNNGVGGGASINLDGVQNSVIQNNQITQAHASGIALFKINGATGSMNNTIANNTILVSSTGRWGILMISGSTGNQLVNNAIHSAQSFRGAIAITSDSMAGFQSDYNVTENRFSTDGGSSATDLAGWRAATGQDLNTKLIPNNDPNVLFVNAAGGDFRPATGSVLIDAGTRKNAPKWDLAGVVRPSGAAHDVGAYEVPDPIRTQTRRRSPAVSIAPLSFSLPTIFDHGTEQPFHGIAVTV